MTNTYRPFDIFEIDHFVNGSGRFGEELRLGLHGFTYDPITYEMLGIRKGTDDIDVARASERWAQNWEDVYYSVNAYEIAWYGGRNVENLLRYSEDLENEAWKKNANVSVSGKEVTFTESGSSLQNYAYDRTFSVSSGNAYVNLTLTDEFVRYSYHGNFEGHYCVWSADLKSGTTNKCQVRLYFGKNSGSCFQIREDGDYDHDTIFLDKAQLQVVTARTEKTIPDEYQPTDTAISDELVVNGTFDADTDWNKYGDDGAGQDTEISGGQAHLYSNGVDRGSINQPIGIKKGVTYKYTAETVSSGVSRKIFTANSDLAYTSSVDVIEDWMGDPGVFDGTFTATDDASYLMIAAQVASSHLIIDNVFITEASTGRAVYGCENPNTVTDNVVTLGPRVPFAEMPWASGAPAATNKITYSRDLSSWTGRGTGAATYDQDGIDGMPNTASLVTGLGVDVTNDLFKAASGLSISTPIGMVLWLKASTTTGILGVRNTQGAGYGSWDIDVSLLSTTEFEKVTASHPAVTVNTAFTSTGGGLGGALFYCTLGGVDIIVGNVNFLESSDAIARGIPPIPTEGSAVSTQADEYSADILNHGDNEEVCYIFHLKLSYDYDEKSDGQAILSLNGGHSIAFDRPAAGTFSSNHGASLSEVTGINYSAGDILKIGIRASISSNEMSITVDGAEGTVVAYDGYAITTALQIVASAYEMKIRDLRRYAITGGDAQKAKIDELMA